MSSLSDISACPELFNTFSLTVLAIVKFINTSICHEVVRVKNVQNHIEIFFIDILPSIAFTILQILAKTATLLRSQVTHSVNELVCVNSAVLPLGDFAFLHL